MLWIPIGVQNEIIQHAWEDRPNEACGVVSGEKGSGIPNRVIRIRNAQASSAWYSFDPEEQLEVWREMDQRDEDPYVVYHSHVTSEAYPSGADISCAVDPKMHYLIVGLRGPGIEFRSFRIIDGEVLEEKIGIL